jgi:hypothetical protein
MTEEKKVTVDDVVEVLAKHSASPNDPDDADTLSRFNEQVAEERRQKEGGDEEQREKREPSQDAHKPSSPTGSRKEKP